jgi:putative isomerase
MGKMKWLLAAAAALIGAAAGAQGPARAPEYAAVQARLQHGWNSWDTNSVTEQVLLPEGLGIALGVRRRSSENTDAFLPGALIGRKGKDDEKIIPGPHAYDGSYSALRLTWRGVDLRLETASVDSDLVMLVTPLSTPAGAAPADGRTTFLRPDEKTSQPAVAVFSTALLWNRAGSVAREGDHLVARLPAREIGIFGAGHAVIDPNLPVAGPYLALGLDGPAAVSTGHARSLADVTAIVARGRDALAARTAAGSAAEVRAAIETVLGWDTIYDPAANRVLSPVSRIWSQQWGGYVVFDWDTFFAGTLAAIGNRDLAYANVLEVLAEATPAGFVPNYARAGGWKSWDRSEPPVGALTILDLYRRFGDRWLLDQSYAALLKWNRWWPAHRAIGDYLVWGSDPDTQPRNPDDLSVGTLQGARYESGLDNSPMYDGAGFDGRLMQLADVGLMSMYIADCDALGAIATTLGRKDDARELAQRSKRFRASLATLWDPAAQIFRNKDLRTGTPSARISPTSFYPMLAHAASASQADAMIRRYLLDPARFGGPLPLPSAPRDDPAFKDQDYWRGRIWGPMNYLVWRGLRNYDSPTARQARAQLGQRSLDLFLGEWRAKGHVHENYSATGSDSDTSETTDWFYHWGALLGLIGPGVDTAGEKAPH